ncbi:MAG TPA: EF-hand domain-containing protein [Candidatus Didemnitutus sp.]|nr:EF-hand domain-containing protein [Candidatus Didemnitutus sp.]
MKSLIVLASGLALCALPHVFADNNNGTRMGETSDPKFREVDANGDGRISRAEYTAYDQQKFSKMDANGDGFVSLDEMAAYDGGMGEKATSDWFKKIDTDGDGKLSATEHAAGCDMMFTRMDTDGDGFVSPSEFAAAHKDKMKKGKDRY